MMSPEESTDANSKRCRYACTFCSEKKIKCDGLQPCSQCKKRHKECVYMTKKKPTSKVRRTDTFGHQQCPQVTFAPSMGSADHVVAQPSWGGHAIGGFQGIDMMSGSARLLPRAHGLSGMPCADVPLQPVALGTTEKRYLQQYMRIVNTFVPLLPSSMIRDAMNPISFDILGVTARQLDQVKQAACKAATWGAISMGASISHDPAAAVYLRKAVSNLRECFDHPCREAFCAYLVVAEGYCMMGDKQSFLRYVSFADLIRRELTEDLGVEAEVAMNHVRSQCYSITRGGKRFGKFVFPDFSQLAKYPTNLYAVSIINFVLVGTFDSIENSNMDAATTRRTFAHYVTLLEPLKVRLEFEGAQQSNPIALLVCVCMLGLALGKIGRTEEASQMFRTGVDLAESAPYLVCMPLTWHSMSVLHRYFAGTGQTELARRLEVVLLPNFSKWTAYDSTTHLPLTDGVFNVQTRDMKDIVIRDLIETFARSDAAGAAETNRQQQEQTTTKTTSEHQQGEMKAGPPSYTTAKSSFDDFVGGTVSHHQHMCAKSQSMQHLASPDRRQQLAIARSRSLTPVPLDRTLSDASNFSLTCECFGDLIDEETIHPNLFQDSSIQPSEFV